MGLHVVFLMLNFKPVFSLSSFTFIKKLFSIYVYKHSYVSSKRWPVFNSTPFPNTLISPLFYLKHNFSNSSFHALYFCLEECPVFIAEALNQGSYVYTFILKPTAGSQSLTAFRDVCRLLLTSNSTQWVSLGAQLVKHPPAVRETWIPSLGWEDPLEKGTATHSSILTWRIPGSVQRMGSHRVGHD